MTKRGIDIAISLSWLILLSLPFALIALAIKAESRGPVFFRQKRAGARGKVFVIWKFRTMVDGAAKKGLGDRVEKGDARITRIGSLLRALSLDELPQIFNILNGDMSFVGPRPTLTHQVEAYNDHQRRRLEVRPGITSWASVNGRNRLSWEDRIEMDIWYVDHLSLWLDLKILFKTFWVAFVTRDGVYAEDGANEDFGAPLAPLAKSTTETKPEINS